jgi:hypothetical protein
LRMPHQGVMDCGGTRLRCTDDEKVGKRHHYLHNV